VALSRDREHQHVRHVRRIRHVRAIDLHCSGPARRGDGVYLRDRMRARQEARSDTSQDMINGGTSRAAANQRPRGSSNATRVPREPGW
jgi:hypothetical protein